MNITTTDPQQTEGAICLIQIKERQGLLIYNLGLAMRTLITETWSQYLPRGLKNLVGEEVPEARSEGATRRGRHPRRPVRAAAAWQRPVPAGALRGGAAGADGVDTPHAGAAGGGRRAAEMGAWSRQSVFQIFFLLFANTSTQLVHSSFSKRVNLHPHSKISVSSISVSIFTHFKST